MKSVLLALALVLLAGCESTLPRGDDDKTGDLGREHVESRADVYVKMAVEYMRFNKYSVALQKLKRGLQEDPNNPQVHNILGIVYQKLGENDFARKHFEKAISLANEDPFVHNAYGSFLCQNSDYGAAIEQFDEAVKNPLNPSVWIAYSNAGSCALDENKLDQAEHYLRLALQANPTFPTALKLMMIAKYKSGSAFRARAYLQRYEQVARHTAETLYYAYLVEMGNNKNAKAQAYAHRLESEFPDSRETMLYDKGIK